MVEKIPLTVLKLRVRRNIMDYLELASSQEEQRDYESSVPIAHVPHELINQWTDSVNDKDFGWYSEPEFSADEQAAMKQFQDVWECVINDTPNPMPNSIESLLGTEVWQRLMDAAQSALNVFMVRGRISDTTKHLV